jgi:hypothetical protein
MELSNEQREAFLQSYGQLESDVMEDEAGEFIWVERDEERENDEGVSIDYTIPKKVYLPIN